MASCLMVVGGLELGLSLILGLQRSQWADSDPSVVIIVLLYLGTGGVSGLTILVSSWRSFGSVPSPAVASVVQAALAATGTLALALPPLFMSIPGHSPLGGLVVGGCLVALVVAYLFVQAGRWGRGEEPSAP